jgi:hypothetical protein
MLSLVLDVEVECLLRQLAADLDLRTEELAALMLGSALISSFTR